MQSREALDVLEEVVGRKLNWLKFPNYKHLIFSWEIAEMYIIAEVFSFFFFSKLGSWERKIHNNDRYGLLCLYLKQSEKWFTEIQIMFDKRKNVVVLSDNEILSPPRVNGNAVGWNNSICKASFYFYLTWI